MSNGAYNELRRLLIEGDLTDHDRKRLTTELIMDIHEVAIKTNEGVIAHEERIEKLEANPSLAAIFRAKPFKASAILLTIWTVLDLVAEQVPEALAYLVKLP